MQKLCSVAVRSSCLPDFNFFFYYYYFYGGGGGELKRTPHKSSLEKLEEKTKTV